MKTQFYSKRPDTFEVIQWNGKNNDEVSEFTKLGLSNSGNTDKIQVQTATGLKDVKNGDYFVKDSKGNIDVVAKEDFDSQYEASSAKQPKKDANEPEIKPWQGSDFPVPEAPPEADEGSLATTQADVVTQPNDTTPSTEKAKTPTTKTQKK